MPEQALCSVEGCCKPARGRGWCGTHWWRWRYNGSPTALRPKPVKPAHCSVDGCEKPPNGKRGMCNAHYLRAYRHGDPLAGGTSQGAPMAWIEANKGYDGPDCLTWPFARGHDGRGRLNRMHDAPQAHRMMCLAVHGPPPSDLHEAAHSCGRGHEGCCAPHHLRWATHVENMDDQLVHGTRARGERSGGAKLTEGDVRAIRSLKGRATQRAIGDRFGVDAETVGNIHRRETWAWFE